MGGMTKRGWNNVGGGIGAPCLDPPVQIPILHFIMKYRDEKRERRKRERKERKENILSAQAIARMREARNYSAGDAEKNSHLMLDALGLPLRRKLLMRLKREGAMSLSKLGQPFGMKLPRLYGQMRILERAGIIETHKRGRVRMCILNRKAFNELSVWLKAFAR